MIEEMKKVTLLTTKEKKKDLITSLRDFSLVHIKNIASKSEKGIKIEKMQSNEKKILSILEGYVDKKNKAEQKELSGNDFSSLLSGLTSLIERKAEKEEEVRKLSSEIERVKDFGSFNSEDLLSLSSYGINIDIYYVDSKSLKVLEKDENVKFIRIKTNGKSSAVALINSSLPDGVYLNKFTPPSSSLSSLETSLTFIKNEIEEIDKNFKASTPYIDEIKMKIKKDDEKILFENVSSSTEDDENLVTISGYIPSLDVPSLKEYCKKNGIGYYLDDIKDDDNPPTKLKEKGFIRFIEPLYNMLGLVPGYREKDISLYFLLFMTLFFAMIIGDAGYGLIFFLVALFMNIKSKKCSDMNALIYIFGGATIIWGALTGTWFGSEAILKNVPFLRIFVIKELTNFPELFSMDALFVQDNMMTLCFTIGAFHLSLACLLCIFDKIPKKDFSFLSDLGWLSSTLSLYLLVLYLVVNKSVNFTIIIMGVAVGFLLVCLFSEQSPGKSFLKGIKQSLGGFFTTFINTISCFSNVMSYIRLFAVGLASLAIAQSFNGMAEGMLSGFMLPFGILILLLGHTVNIVMGFLSIVVHGVRLNIMEFSGQVGVEWSGYKYDPFRKKEIKIKK